LQRAIERAEYAETVAEHALAMLQEEQGRAGQVARESIEELHAELVAATDGLAQSQQIQQQVNNILCSLSHTLCALYDMLSAFCYLLPALSSLVGFRSVTTALSPFLADCRSKRGAGARAKERVSRVTGATAADKQHPRHHSPLGKHTYIYMNMHIHTYVHTHTHLHIPM
jgi:hypothetical protein